MSCTMGIDVGTTGTRVVIVRPDGYVVGAALLAGVGAKIYSSVEESARQTIQIKERMAPRPENGVIYGRYCQVYRNLYPAVRELAHTLAKLGTEGSQP
jgi:xylulokinase